MTQDQELQIYRALFSTAEDVRRVEMAKVIIETNGDSIARHFGASEQRTAHRVKEKLVKCGMLTFSEVKPVKESVIRIYRKPRVNRKYVYSTGEFV